jgi:hypothetical protein
VLAGARDPRRGTEAARELGATFIHIDPTDDSVEAAAARVHSEFTVGVVALRVGACLRQLGGGA